MSSLEGGSQQGVPVSTADTQIFCGMLAKNAKLENNHVEDNHIFKLKDSLHNNWPIFFKNLNVWKG